MWRCYPQVLETHQPQIHLLPADLRIPDTSVWSHASTTAALAGALAGYYSKAEDYPPKGASDWKRSQPHLAIFTFSPVQELIKASRKMRDFWAGSWLLHYLSAKVCWAIANKYGADSLLYPCLYEQPLIDHWLLQKYPDFQDWIKQPSLESVLTAGFPNVIVLILPNNGQDSNALKGNPVRAAMQYARETLHQEWKILGDAVLTHLQKHSEWSEINPHTWEGWLKHQWQTYWIGSAIGNPETQLHQSPDQTEEFKTWVKSQNDFAQSQPELFHKDEVEIKFIKAIFELNSESAAPDRVERSNLNIGSWWGSLFDQTRRNLSSAKNARNWQIPTAFGPRSTVSGMGSVIHPIYDPQKPDWATEGQTADFWKADLGLFNSIEELNATEVLKRGLHKVLMQQLFPNDSSRWSEKPPLVYPDLSSGTAGWLRHLEETGQLEKVDFYHAACQQICDRFSWTTPHEDAPASMPWGIPWIAEKHPQWKNPRLLNPGWLLDDYHPDSTLSPTAQKQAKQQETQKLRKCVDSLFSVNNPTDWYVLAAGDGDGMSEWLKGAKLHEYNRYIPEALHSKIQQLPEACRVSFEAFLGVRKRMGPATHSALSRALLDFSNQLVPYLTQERYAGRLIYSGGDDVLAYTNLWEWDRWLWDIRSCFRGDDDPRHEFTNQQGNYWSWAQNTPSPVANRPLFTMGSSATISFGIVIAHQSVPLAIALEHLWEAEEQAKEHLSPTGEQKDAVQVRAIYANGNLLEATAKFDVFFEWQQLLSVTDGLESALFEQAATLWTQHPAPVLEALPCWVNAFCDRRDFFKQNETAKAQFAVQLATFFKVLWENTTESECSAQICNWLKLAAFVLRNRQISCNE